MLLCFSATAQIHKWIVNRENLFKIYKSKKGLCSFFLYFYFVLKYNDGELI
jgi:phosphate starvation-inducible membrane PsiE